jgi:ABC-type microcin C transport system duplicated ATPase subunit YejF
MPLLEVKNLKVHFPVKHGMFSRVREFVKAVDDVSFSVAPGETLGCAIVRRVEPTAGGNFSRLRKSPHERHFLKSNHSAQR